MYVCIYLCIVFSRFGFEDVVFSIFNKKVLYSKQGGVGSCANLPTYLSAADDVAVLAGSNGVSPPTGLLVLLGDGFHLFNHGCR